MNDINLIWSESSSDEIFTSDIENSTINKSKLIDDFEKIDLVIAKEKKKELEQIEEDFEHLSEAMKHTSKLIEDQSPVLSDIEYDIEECLKNTTNGVSSLGKAENGFWLATFAAVGFTTVGLVLAASTQSRHLIPQIKSMLWTPTDNSSDDDTDQKSSEPE
tara:strand:- start:3630 stop:4112 length:483 start_codon:yes stop_codon:yes gene_type:complete